MFTEFYKGWMRGVHGINNKVYTILFGELYGRDLLRNFIIVGELRPINSFLAEILLMKDT
jgi:hypothetical protein